MDVVGVLLNSYVVCMFPGDGKSRYHKVNQFSLLLFHPAEPFAIDNAMCFHLIKRRMKGKSEIFQQPGVVRTRGVYVEYVANLAVFKIDGSVLF